MDLNTGFIALSAAISIAVGAASTAWAQSTIGAGATGLMAEKDGKEGNVLIMLALPETIIILSFVIAFFLIGKIVE
jgi:V/A-type H+-transporting ATPase subunit K